MKKNCCLHERVVILIEELCLCHSQRERMEQKYEKFVSNYVYSLFMYIFAWMNLKDKALFWKVHHLFYLYWKHWLWCSKCVIKYLKLLIDQQYWIFIKLLTSMHSWYMFYINNPNIIKVSELHTLLD